MDASDGALSFDAYVDSVLAMLAGPPPKVSEVSRVTRYTDFSLPGTAAAPIVPAAQSNGISSTLDHWHLAPVIDLDGPHTYVPSDTPGHAHLHLDQRMHYVKVLALMAALRWARVIERGHWKGFLHRGFSVVRPPWARKTMREYALMTQDGVVISIITTQRPLEVVQQRHPLFTVAPIQDVPQLALHRYRYWQERQWSRR